MNHFHHLLPKQIFEIVNWQARIFENALPVVALARGVERRYIEYVWFGPLLREQAQCNFVNVDQFVYRRIPIVKETDKPQPPRTLPRTRVHLAFLDSRIAENAL